MRRRALIAGLTVALPAAVGSAAWAAPLSAADLADLKRAYAASALASSEAPVVREERRLREPSPGFMLGAALGAWTAARDQLDYDLKNPQAAGPPHASQGPADVDAIDQDCREEEAAFERLEARGRTLSLDPSEVLEAAALPEPAVLDAWRARRGHAPAC
jgi:hypothetical protein